MTKQPKISSFTQMVARMRRDYFLAALFILGVGTVVYLSPKNGYESLDAASYQMMHLGSLLILIAAIPALFQVNRQLIKRILEEKDPGKKLRRYSIAFKYMVYPLAALTLFPATIVLLGGPVYIGLEIPVILILVLLQYPSVSSLSEKLHPDHERNSNTPGPIESYEKKRSS